MEILLLPYFCSISLSLFLNMVFPCRAVLSGIFQTFVYYGKTRKETRRENFNLFDITVPKKWFAYFYLWGLIWTVFISCLAFIDTAEYEYIASFLHFDVRVLPFAKPTKSIVIRSGHIPLEVALVLLVILLQLFRRTYESFFITRFGSSRMHLGHFAFGLFFYTSLAPLALHQLDNGHQVTHIPIKWSFLVHCTWKQAAGIVLFLWSSLHQFKCHTILAKLRERNERYAIPKGDWFDHVSSPHYTAEILIYLSLLLCSNCHNLYLLLPLFSTIGLLLLSARITHSWYKKNFKDYPIERKIIIHWLY
ncbi:PREDICTED: polyprenol reductase-like [Amphimedon queenslandica]|uniref:Polyprenal reductase n=2 Tax=Amphimedon queenslandica TaxID=400682 RepID=A0AAN0IZE4_AMPQE|nr:PREDICTED: polyprenol reductase-like [Amphimedon queenslandica]|eukprot:XP_019849821.1 PREDICTED: polyprenol reductase-like [Amphimedon queenslandica]